MKKNNFVYLFFVVIMIFCFHNIWAEDINKLQNECHQGKMESCDFLGYLYEKGKKFDDNKNIPKNEKKS
ncbi:MAG: hypothetical protein IJ143_07425, partial [Neisseriaceae bacterium]|nr:hypothetical protein [Neisseriaceae bacterium]